MEEIKKVTDDEAKNPFGSRKSLDIRSRRQTLTCYSLSHPVDIIVSGAKNS